MPCFGDREGYEEPTRTLPLRVVLPHLCRRAGPSTYSSLLRTLVALNRHSLIKRFACTVLHGSPRLCEADAQWMDAVTTRTAAAKRCHCGLTAFETPILHDIY